MGKKEGCLHLDLRLSLTHPYFESLGRRSQVGHALGDPPRNVAQAGLGLGRLALVQAGHDQLQQLSVLDSDLAAGLQGILLRV